MFYALLKENISFLQDFEMFGYSPDAYYEMTKKDIDQ